MTHKTPIRQKVSAALKAAAVASLILAPAAAFGQQAPAPPQPQGPAQEAQAIQQRLQSIQQKALEENPELQQMQKDYEASVEKAMKEKGANPDEDIERLREIQSKAADQELSDEERQALVGEFQKIRQKLMQAEQQAMQSAEVASKREELQEAVVDAMVEEDPETEKLLEKQEKLRQEMIRQQQGPQGAPQTRPQQP